MDAKSLSQEPHVLELNRVERLYTGGKLLDRWQGIQPGNDGVKSEEFIVSTNEYIGPDTTVIENGISRTRLNDGDYVNLKNLIALDETAFLGKRYAGLTHGQSGVLARVGDSTVRLVIQVHPDAEAAQKYLQFPSGKAEAWVILDSREINGVTPYLYVGFQKGVTKEKWRALFDAQDVPGMLDCMHRIPVKTGDAVLVEAGMPHAMGSGCLFLEIHEACDYTFRLEKQYAVRPLSDEEMHYGIGYDAMFDIFHYDTYTEEEIREKYVMKPKIIDRNENGVLSQVLTYENTPRFAAQVLNLSGTYTLPDFDGHAIIISSKGETELIYENGKKMVPQGRGVFVPANVKGMQAKGNGQLVIAYPFQT